MRLPALGGGVPPTPAQRYVPPTPAQRYVPPTPAQRYVPATSPRLYGPATASQRRVLSIAMTAALGADSLFAKYATEAPQIQSGLYARCWDIVDDAVAATVPNATPDASAFGGALEAFVSAGPDDPSLVPEEQRGLITALSDTAASYSQLVDARRLSWATRYRTLNRPLGAFFCGISLWPITAVDVPNFTLYFGSGSAVNPNKVFMRLEMVPRVDTDTDAACAPPPGAARISLACTGAATSPHPTPEPFSLTHPTWLPHAPPFAPHRRREVLRAVQRALLRATPERRLRAVPSSRLR